MFKIIKSKKDIISLIVISIIFSLGVCGAALYISNEYFKTHAYFYDPVGDYSKTIPFYERMQEESHLNQITSRVNFAILWFQGDPKSPFLYIPTILFCPRLLTTSWAIMPSMFFALCSFLYMLGYSLRMRNQSFLSVVSLLFLFCAGHLMFNPERGIAAGWLDLPAGFLLTSGIIAFLNWRDFRNNYWLILSAVFVALASMSRSTLIIYAAILLSVPVILSFIEQKRASLRLLGFYILLIAILIAPFYYYSFAFNYKYYTSLSSGVADSITSSFFYIMHAFSFIGIGYCIAFVVLLCSLFYMHRRDMLSQSKYQVGTYAWLLSIMPITWVFVQKTGGTYHVHLTIYALFFILFIGIAQNSKQSIAKRVSYGVIAFSSVYLLYSFATNRRTAQIPTEEAADTKQLYTNIAKHVAQLQPNETWLAYFDEDVTRIANIETYNQYGVYPKKYAQGILYFHHSYWRAEYGEMSDTEIADSLVKLLPQSAFVVIPHSHKGIDSIVPQKFTTTRKVLHTSLNYIIKNNWEKREGFRSLKYGDLDVYYNKLF